MTEGTRHAACSSHPDRSRYRRIAGIGADVAQQLAGPDTHVVVNYREKAKRANTVVDAIRRAGGRASSLGADISDEAAAAAMIERIGRSLADSMSWCSTHPPGWSSALIRAMRCG